MKVCIRFTHNNIYSSRHSLGARFTRLNILLICLICYRCTVTARWTATATTTRKTPTARPVVQSGWPTVARLRHPASCHPWITITEHRRRLSYTRRHCHFLHRQRRIGKHVSNKNFLRLYIISSFVWGRKVFSDFDCWRV